MGKIEQAMRSVVKSLMARPMFRDYVYYSSQFPKYGLMSNDTIRKDSQIVQEALRRLPKDVAVERQFRISRALYLDSKQQILPRDQWTKYEDDDPYLIYLMEQVKLENKEMRDYDISFYTFKSGQNK